VETTAVVVVEAETGTLVENAQLQGADLKKADLTNANLGGSTQLQGARLRGAKLEGAILEGAEYDADTVFPIGFDPHQRKTVLKPSPPPDRP
jgi:Pentapeptide repeats (8 copies)